MKDGYLAVRIPAALVRVLGRMSRSRGVSKSQIVREAVASYSLGSPVVADRKVVTASELARRWASLPRLDAVEATAFAGDIASSRAAVPPPTAPWE